MNNDELDDATVIVPADERERLQAELAAVDDATVIVSADERKRLQAELAAVDDATVIVSADERERLQAELAAVDDATTMVTRTSPTIEEATILTTTGAEPELHSETSTNGRGLVSETSQPTPVPELEIRKLVIAKPEVSTVQEAESVIDPTKVDPNTRVSSLDGSAVSGVGTAEIERELVTITPPVVTRTGPSRDKLLKKNKRRRSLSSPMGILLVVLSTLVFGGGLAIVVALLI